MNRESLLEKGIAPELVDEILAMHGANVASLKAKVNEQDEQIKSYSNLQNQKSQLEKRVKELEGSNLTQEQKLAQREQEIEAKGKEYDKLINTVKAKNVLLEAGIPTEKLDAILGNIVSDNEETTLAGVNSIVELYKDTVDSTSKKVKDEFLKNNPKPPASNGTGEEGEISKEDFQKMNYNQQMDLYNTNPELYNKLSE